MIKPNQPVLLTYKEKFIATALNHHFEIDNCDGCLVIVSHNPGKKWVQFYCKKCHRDIFIKDNSANISQFEGFDD